MSNHTRNPILRMMDVSKSFGVVKALSNVNLSVFAGEVHTLMGENGAGKSTLMKILSGAYTPDAGSKIEFDGTTAGQMTPSLARRLGISVIYQELSLAANLTVAENIFLGIEPRGAFGLLNRSEMHKLAAPVLEKLGVSFSSHSVVSGLSLGQRQEVEIARALAQNAKLIVMDEPTTSLTKQETDRLFNVIHELREQGIAIIYISHRMEEIYALSDQCTVLRDGVSVGTLSRADLSAERLINMMVGRDLEALYHPTGDKVAFGDTPAFEVVGLTVGTKVKDCSLTCHAGEVLGISGLVGSGRTELARAIFGADRRDTGEIRIAGKRVDPQSPTQALAAGLSYLTEDRKELGLFLDMSVSDNINISVQSDDAIAAIFRNFKVAAKRSDNSMKQLSVRAANAGISVSALSGGNQQKVLFARLLETKPQVLILDEPTRGVDIGAKSEIYGIIAELAKSGVAIIVISSDLPEIVGICDRVLVMREGEIAGEILPDSKGVIHSTAIMNLSVGMAENFGPKKVAV
jgi:ribose transport system ATP-binding protein